MTGAVLAFPAVSGATVTCSGGSTVPQVDLGGDFDLAFLEVLGNGTIQISTSGGSTVACDGGAPTVNNTAAMSIFNHSGAAGGSVVIVNAEAFGPGVTVGTDENSGSGTPEIELFVNLHDAPGGTLSVRSDGGSVRFGDSGINPNATPSEVVPDADIFPIEVARLEGRNGTSLNSAPSVFSAEGGLGTGGPLTSAIDLLGNGGADELTGSVGSDRLTSLGGNDSLAGGGGDDVLEPGAGADSVDGGDGTDLLSYLLGSLSGVAIDLEIAGPQNGAAAGTEIVSSIEDVDATTGGDVIRGDDGPNHIKTAAGNDVIEGRGGVDIIEAGITAAVANDDDTIDVRDGGPDTVSCGVGLDTVIADQPGVDTLTDCENVAYAAGTSTDEPGGTTGPGGTGGAGGTTTPPATFGAHTLVSLRLAARRIRARGPLRVRVTNRNTFAVTGTLAGRTVRRVPTDSALRRVRLARRAIMIAGESARTVRLRLPRSLRRVLARRGKLVLQLTGRVTDPAGNSRTVKKRVTPRLKRR